MARSKIKQSAKHAVDDPRAATMFRPLASQLDAIDERAERAGLSRNAWIEKACQHVLDLPTK